MTGKIYIGIGGWTFEPWRGVFYPDDLTQKRELEYASRKLTSIEINGTYYSSFKPANWAKWRDDTPEGFVFAVKASRFCTNRRVLADAGESVQRFVTLGSFIFWWLTAAWLWDGQRGWAWACLAMPFLLTPLILGMQCLWSAQSNRDDPSPPASLGQWLLAWLAEAWVAGLVFSWWQPFRRLAIADGLHPTPGRRGMVLVHGFFCNRAFWTRWMQRLAAQGRVFVAVDLEPAYGTINNYGLLVERAVQQVELATGLPPVIVGHSMGGLAIRAWAACAFGCSFLPRLTLA